MKLYCIASIVIFMLLSETAFTQDISFTYDLAGNRIKRNSACDLTPTLGINSLQFTANTQKDFIINIFEINNQETVGAINLRITKLSAFSITYPLASSISNVFGGTQNQNSDWTFSENANFIFITSKAGTKIAAKAKAVIGFNIARKSGTAAGTTQNISAVVFNTSGGEVNAANNQVITSVATN